MSEYEFTEEQNVVIDGLRKNMTILTGVLVVGGLAALISGILDFSWLDIIAGLTVMAIGVSLFFPTDNFKKITSTEGDDIKEMMIAFNELDKGWLIVNIFTVVYALSKLYLFISVL